MGQGDVHTEEEEEEESFKLFIQKEELIQNRARARRRYRVCARARQRERAREHVPCVDHASERKFMCEREVSCE